MVRRLPSLNQLRSFEAAARHESIKHGAEELSVTPTAVSHQIKALEQALNTSLFRRMTRQITLTEAGRELAVKLGKAMDEIEAAVAMTQKSDQIGIFKITVAPFFGNRWLLPRLPAFEALHPEIKIETFLSFDNVDLDKSGFDAAVRYGSGEWQGMSSELICNDRIRPVCAPQLLDGCELPVSADRILEMPLACASHWRDDWLAWADAAGMGGTARMNIVEYESRAVMFDAALSGNAVILADPKLTAADEAVGRLVHLNPLTVDRPQGIYIVASEKSGPDPRRELFASWLKQESSKFNNTGAENGH